MAHKNRTFQPLRVTVTHPETEVKRAATYVLPDGWTMCVDEASGFPMYYCDASGETRWDPPEVNRLFEG